MQAFKSSHILEIFILLVFVACCCDAWGRRRSGSSSSSSKGSISRAAKFVGDAVKGAQSMYAANKDMREVNSRSDLRGHDKTGVDKYFHAKANNEAAKHGPGGEFAAKVISDVKEAVDTIRGRGSVEARRDSAADQEANKHGRNGGDPNVYRPDWLPDNY